MKNSIDTITQNCHYGMKKKLWIGISTVILILLGGGTSWFFLCQEHFVPYDIKEECITVEKEEQKRYFRRGTFTMRTDCYLNPVTFACYQIPIDAAGNPLPTAANIVFYSPFNGELGDQALERYPWVREFAESYGCSVFSLRIRADTFSGNDRRKYYIYREAGWDDGIFATADFLRQRFHLPEKKIALIGQSSGGTFALRIAQDWPERIAVVAVHGGELVNARWPEMPQSVLPPVLILNGHEDYTVHQGRKGPRLAHGTRWRVWYGEPRTADLPNKHEATSASIAQMQNFILQFITTNEKRHSQSFDSAFGENQFHFVPGEILPDNAKMDGDLIQ